MSPLGKHRIVLVSGPPASGKTTLARPLAERLGFALLTKDDIKETLFTAMQGPPGDVEFSRKIGAASMDLLWALAPHCPASCSRRISARRARTSAPKSRRLQKPARRSSKSIAAFPAKKPPAVSPNARASERHHPAHVLAEMPPDRMIEYEEPFALSPVLEVDTTHPVDIEALARQIEAAWAR
jgi:hypothetical protein